MKKWIFVLLLSGCSTVPSRVELIEEVRLTEEAFADYAASNGIQAAFAEFGAPEAAIQRDNKVVKGIDAIERYYAGNEWENVTLSWSPKFIEVSVAGDFAYTYGDYIFQRSGSAGVMIESIGVFHTVWKRQPDGKWKYVWD